MAAAAVLILLFAGARYLHDSQKINECQSELHTTKLHPDGSTTELHLTAVLRFNRTTSLKTLYKGSLKTPDGTYMLDRTYSLTLNNVNDSNIYHCAGRKISLSADDNAPATIVQQLQLDNIDFFFITPLRENAWLLHTLMFPAMVCKGR